MKVCVVPSLLVCGLQATHLLRLFHHNNNAALLPGSTRGSLFTFNNYFGDNSGNINNNAGGGSSTQGGQGSYSGQTATGGNTGVTRQVPR